MVPVPRANILRAIVIAGLVAAVTVSPGLAQSGSGASGAPRSAAIVRLANGTTFNWLTKKTRPGLGGAVLVSTDNTPRVKRARVFGRGSYVCSPAGFGRKSSCYAR